jgi:hypothetical protein
VVCYRDAGDLYQLTDMLEHLGDCHHDMGDVRAARTGWQEALDVLVGLGASDADRIRLKLAGLPAAAR